jgi:hypothetical protein
MSNRFHSKYHRSNHHTDTKLTLGQINADGTPTNADTGHDPIAHPDFPFMGVFTLRGGISACPSETNPLKTAGYFVARNSNDNAAKFIGNVAISGNTTTTGTFLFADGTATAPSIANIDDPNNGIYFPSADVFAITTNASEKLRIDPNGSIWEYYPTPATYASVAAGTLLLYSDLIKKILICSGTTTTLTLPTALNLDSASPLINSGFSFYVINTGSSAVTLLTNSNLTLTGNMTVATSTTGKFLIRKTATGVFSVYRKA